MSIILALIMLFSMAFAAEEVVEYGNTICPISGEKIAAGEEIKYEYEGVNYNLCCKMCIKDFEKDPEKYIKKMDVEKQMEKRRAVEAGLHGHHH